MESTTFVPEASLSEGTLTLRCEHAPDGTLAFACALADPSALHASPMDVERFLSVDGQPFNRVWTLAA